MIRKFGFTFVALLGMLVVFTAAPASAQTRFGVFIGGGPAYRYVAPPVYPPYPVPYDSYYASPVYPYYPAPVYVGPSYGYGYGYGYRGGYYGRGHEDRHDFRGGYGGRGHEGYRGGYRR